MRSKRDAVEIDPDHVPCNGYIVDGMFYGTLYEVEQYGPPGAAKRAKKLASPVKYGGGTLAISMPTPPSVPRRKKPSPLVLTRDERTQRHRARAAVAAAVRNGILPRQATQSCADCGASGPLAFIQYDHFMGYDDDCFLTVEPVCRACHGCRSAVETEIRRANADAGR